MSNILTVFSRIFSILMSFFFMLTGGNPDKTEVRIKNTIDTTSTVIEYEIANYSGKTLNADKFFSIEQNINDEWTELPFAEGYATEEIITLVPNCGKAVFRIDLIAAYGHELEEGEYRLVVPCTGKSVLFTTY